MAAARLLIALLAALLAPLPVGAQAAEVVDDTGRAVSLARPAGRIVSLAPHATEMLFAAGAGASVIATVEHSDYPAAASRLPHVGGAQGFDIERILALKPDLIVAWESGNPVALLERLEQLGLTVYRSEPRRLEDIARNIERLGALAGSGAEAGRYASRFRARAAELARRPAQPPKPRVFYQIWDRPLMTVNGEHLISHVIALCGGRNVFAGLPVLAPSVEREAVLRADPDVIIAGTMPGGEFQWTLAWQRYPWLSAVRRGNLFTVDADLLQRPGPRVLEGAAMLCRILETVRTE